MIWLVWFEWFGVVWLVWFGWFVFENEADVVLQSVFEDSLMVV